MCPNGVHRWVCKSVVLCCDTVCVLHASLSYTSSVTVFAAYLWTTTWVVWAYVSNNMLSCPQRSMHAWAIYGKLCRSVTTVWYMYAALHKYDVIYCQISSKPKFPVIFGWNAVTGKNYLCLGFCCDLMHFKRRYIMVMVPVSFQTVMYLTYDVLNKLPKNYFQCKIRIYRKSLMIHDNKVIIYL